MNPTIKEKFLLAKESLNFNHGSFGTVPKSVFNAHIQFLREQEECPEDWFREIYFGYINSSRQSIASMVKGELDDLILLENASSAINAILRTFPFQRNDKVFIFSSSYPMVIETLRYLEKSIGIVVVKIPVTYPLQRNEQLIDALKSAFSDNGNARMCIFSHISSMPSMVKPVKALTKIAKESGSVVLIDGAHAPGVIDIDVKDIGADYYTGNCHKWIFAPKGAAFLWVHKEKQALLCPTVISSTGKWDFVGMFEYTGTRDYTPLTTIPTALQFIHDELGGLEKMRAYNRNLILEGCRYLVEQWKTDYLIAEELTMFMMNVIMPCQDGDKLETMRKLLISKYRMYLVYGHVLQQPDDKKIYFARISSQVYLSITDFHALAKAVLEILHSL